MKPIIEVEKLTKIYKLGELHQPYLTLRDSLKNFFKINSNNEKKYIKALNEISFTVNEGEKIGIIGKNGAGKSTLLKILSRITPPTSGKAILRGKVASLLEVGTGFHGELTGRENIFLNGAILGMKRNEIKQKLDEIVEFSGVEKFLDTPLKHYSSGMQVRLAFAVAAHLNTDILLIDEVLAVGDAEFQKKSLGKMDEISKGGKTILFVSHNMGAIERLCNKSIYLKGGFIKFFGDTETTIKKYLSMEIAEMPQKVWEENNLLGDNIIKLLSVRLLDIAGNCKYIYDYSEELYVEVKFNLMSDNCPYLNLHINSITGEKLFVLVQDFDSLPKKSGRYSVIAKIPSKILNIGKYYIGVAFTTHVPYKIHLYDEYCVFFEVVENINERKHPFKDKLPGFFNPKVTWELLKG
jgi:lipopolysaccharide transport system ATP-binding protein